MMRRFIAPAVAVALGFGCLPAKSQTNVRLVRESFVVETDDTAPKKLGAFDEYVAQKSWDAAISLLRDVAASRPRAMIRVSPHLSVSLGRYCDALLAQLPPDGLAAYRRGIDAQASAWLEEAASTRDQRQLQLIVERAFVSSSGDDAIDRLASFAWERGDFDQARRLWTLLIPLKQGPPDDSPLPALRYPDTDLNVASIRARLVLCGIGLGELTRAKQELDEFRDFHEQAEGHLAGQDGRYAEILTSLLDAATGSQSGNVRSWDVAAHIDGTRTLGTNAARSGAVSMEVSMGGAAWRRALPSSQYGTGVGRPALPPTNPLCYYPVVWQDKVFVADATRVFGFDLESGQAAWSVGNDDPGILYPPAIDAGAVSEVRPYDAAAISGVPRHTLTVDGNRLYARLGLPPTSWPSRELRRAESNIVCLDLTKEGLPLWSLSSDSLGAPEDWWSFEGPPVASGNRLVVIAHRSRPQSQLQAMCLDAATGTVIWNEPIGSPISPPPDGLAVMTHRLPTIAAGRLFVSTNHGAIVCLDTADGRAQWVAWYDSRPVKERAAANAPERNLPATCLVSGGVVVAAPSDSDRLFAYDTTTGVLLWETSIRGGGRELIGVDDGVLVVSGRRLTGLDLYGGGELWTVGYEDPAGFGAGRGLIAGSNAYWPTREDLFVVDIASGTPLRRFPIKKAYGLVGGGNLAVSQTRLLLARPDGLVAFDE